MAHGTSDFPQRLRIGAVCTLVGWASCVGAAWALDPTPAQTQTQWLLHTGGLSHHFAPTHAAGRQWNEQHPGLGLERRETDRADWHWRQSAGIVQDSRSFWGGYAGAAWMKEWRAPGAASLGLGLGAFAFYRSVSWSGRRAWVPALLPTLSLGLLDDRLGVNLMVVPPIGTDGESRPALVFLQMTYRMQ
jgi:hypothetical protein